jgi:serine/threonine protein kinase
MVQRGAAEVLAPEMAMKQGFRCEVDMWALGVIIYIMLFGYNPFENVLEKYTRDQPGDWVWHFPKSRDCSEQADSFV